MMTDYKECLIILVGLRFLFILLNYYYLKIQSSDLVHVFKVWVISEFVGVKEVLRKLKSGKIGLLYAYYAGGRESKCFSLWQLYLVVTGKRNYYLMHSF